MYLWEECSAFTDIKILSQAQFLSYEPFKDAEEQRRAVPLCRTAIQTHTSEKEPEVSPEVTSLTFSSLISPRAVKKKAPVCRTQASILKNRLRPPVLTWD